MKKIYSWLISLSMLVLISIACVSAYAGDGVNELTALNTDISTYYSEYQFAGIELKPALTVKYKGKKLTKNVDYTVEYKDCINAGKATAIVTGMGNYSGEVIKKYIIAPVKTSNEIKPTLEYSITAYDGTYKKPSIKMIYRRDTLIEGKDYELSYSSNKNIGYAEIYVKGKGNYAFKLTKTFRIVHKGVGQLKYSPEVNAITVKWNKLDNVTGYQVVIYDASAKKYKTVKYVPANQLSLRITGLNPSTLYKYNVRAYKEIKGKPTIYGEFTKEIQTRTRSASTVMKSAYVKGNSIVASWKTVRGAGYVLIYDTNSKFTNPKEIYLNDSRISSYTIKNIDNRKKYYVRVCPYTTNMGAKWFSSKSKPIMADYTRLYSMFTSRYVNNANRTKNLTLASKAINGTVVMPGETFSFNKTVGQRTAAKGYKKAAVFTSSSSTAQELGGGICQVASSMFNAALYANVQIVERHQHIQRVSYVPLGRDAAVSWGYQDFRWKNTTKYPIKIYMNVSNGTLTCKFFTVQGVTPPTVKLDVKRSGKTFTLRRYVNGKVTYTTKSKY